MKKRKQAVILTLAILAGAGIIAGLWLGLRKPKETIPGKKELLMPASVTVLDRSTGESRKYSKDDGEFEEIYDAINDGWWIDCSQGNKKAMDENIEAALMLYPEDTVREVIFEFDEPVASAEITGKDSWIFEGKGIVTGLKFNLDNPEPETETSYCTTISETGEEGVAMQYYLSAEAQEHLTGYLDD